MKRERPRCDCGKDLHARDLIRGYCPQCGLHVESAAGERLMKWHGDD